MKNTIKNKKVLITGALGQNGIILSSLLLKKNYQVFGWIRKKKYNNKIKGVSYQIVNLEKKNDILKTLKKINPSVVIHFAAENPSYLDQKSIKIFYTKNYKSTKNIIDSIKSLNLNTYFIFGNSSQIFKKKTNVKYNESDKFLASDAYTRFRLNSLNYLEKVSQKSDFKYTNLILFNHDSKHRNKKFLIPRIINAIKNKDVNFINQIYKENIIGDFSHANDICYAIYLLIKKDIEIKNLILSSSIKTKINLLIKDLLKKNSISIDIKSKPKINTKYIIGDNSLAKRVLKWKPSKNIFNAVNEIFLNS